MAQIMWGIFKMSRPLGGNQTGAQFRTARWEDFPETSKHVCVLSWGRPALKFGVKPQQKAQLRWHPHGPVQGRGCAPSYPFLQGAFFF